MNWEEARKIIDNGSKARRNKWSSSMLYVGKDEAGLLWLYYKMGNKIIKNLFIKDGLNMQTDWVECDENGKELFALK